LFYAYFGSVKISIRIFNSLKILSIIHKVRLDYIDCDSLENENIHNYTYCQG